MTEFTDMVEAAREEARIDEEVKVWRKQIKYILAEKGCIETAYNSGRIEVVYHRDYELHEAGDVITKAIGESHQEVRDRFCREQNDLARG